ncbi:MAG: CRISPR-associated protein Cas4 [Caldisericum sp.]|nr:CRISPR-associated protein Cas4 [Caldisericum sp.]
MVDNIKVSGTLIESYLICKRQAWFHLHKIIPFQDHPFLEIGRLIDETTYERDLKRINLESVQIDFIKTKEGEIVVGEIKKSSKSKDIAKMQLLYYLKVLKDLGVPSKGILSFPTERRREFVELTTEDEEKLKRIVKEIENLSNESFPPPLEKIPFCKNCAYKEFCFS